MQADDIKDAIIAQDTAGIEQAFHALLSEEQVGGLTAGNAMVLLDALAKALSFADELLPRRTCDALGLVHGASYADGAAAVHENRRLWSAYFAARFKRVPRPRKR